MENENAGASTAAAPADNGAAAPEAGQQAAPADDFDYRSPAQIESAEVSDDGGEGSEGEEEQEEAPEVQPKTPPAAEAKTGQEAGQPAASEAPSNDKSNPLFNPKQIEVTLPTKEDGSLDVTALPKFVDDVMAAAQAKAEKVISDRMFVAEEQEAVETAYPDLAKNPARMKIVQDLRMADVLNGGKGDLLEVAKSYMEDRGEAVNQGKQSQKSSIRRQKSARLETAGRTANDGSAKLRQLTKTAFQSNNRADRDAARIERIKLLRSSGQL